LTESLPNKRLWFLPLITLVASLGVSLLFAEMILRALNWYCPVQQESEEPYQFSVKRHHELTPNTRYRHKELEYDYIWENNSLGMRDRQRSPSKDPQSFRIFFLGDSMVQGYGVPLEQTMVSLLETSLNKPEREKKVEVLNGGVFGYSPFLEYLYLKEAMPWVDPDLVIMGFSLVNDVGDDYFYTHQARVSEIDGSVYFEEERWPWSYLNEVVEASAVTTAHDIRAQEPNKAPVNRYWSLLWGHIKPWALKSHFLLSLKKLLNQRRLEREYRQLEERRRAIIRERKDDIRINLRLVNYPVLDRKRRLEYWQVSKKYLAEMHRLCSARGIPMVLVVIPILGPEENEFKEPYEVLDEIGRELSIPVIQLLPEFQKWPPEKLEYEVDGHWNPEGNRLAATVLDRELRKFNLLPPLKNH